jgi:hypothetical protein
MERKKRLGKKSSKGGQENKLKKKQSFIIDSSKKN